MTNPVEDNTQIAASWLLAGIFRESYSKTMIHFKGPLIRQIRSQAESEYPFECCGLLVGRFEANGDHSVLEILPISNARKGSEKRNRSLIRPADLILGERCAAEKGLEIIGNYHSHPDHDAVPSGFDLEHALPVWAYLIVSVKNSQAGELRAWVMANDRSQFRETGIGRGEAALDPGSNKMRGGLDDKRIHK